MHPHYGVPEIPSPPPPPPPPEKKNNFMFIQPTIFGHVTLTIDLKIYQWRQFKKGLTLNALRVISIKFVLVFSMLYQTK